MGKVVFPFSAFVNQDELKLALLLNVINPKIGGVLIKGSKGTGKSSFVYALPDILPNISAIKGCPFNCNPDDLTNMCDECRAKTNIENENRPMRVISLPLGITEDRLIGSINIEEIIKKGVKVLQPGILAMANQNILYIDEINLLPDHITDDILDAAASGWNTVEREGISITHPARFILIGSMNPEEGELRPQILDRLALSVDTKRIESEQERAEVVRRNLLFESDPAEYLELMASEQESLKSKIIEAKQLLPNVEISEALITAIALSCAKLEVDGMRPDVIITKTAMAIAAYEARTIVSEEDVLRASYLALSHRTRKGGFQSPATRNEIKSAFEQMMTKYRGKPGESFKANLILDKKKRFLESELSKTKTRKKSKAIDLKSQIIDFSKIVSAFRTLTKGFNLGATKKQRVKTYLGKHAYSQVSTDRGRRIYAIPYESGKNPLAVLSTIKTGILNGHYSTGKRKLAITRQDLRMWQMMSKVSMTIVLVIDASSSTRHFLQVLAQAIAIIFRDAYRKKDKIGLIVVKDNEARILIQPTRNYQLVLGRLVKIEASGLTPLASGLEKAFFTLKEAKRREREVLPCVVLVSDCYPEPITHKYKDHFQEPAYQAVIKAAKIFEREKIPIVVINPYHGVMKGELKSGTKLGVMIARISKGRYFGIPEKEVDEMSRRGYIKKHAKNIAGIFDELRLEQLHALPDSSERKRPAI